MRIGSIIGTTSFNANLRIPVKSNFEKNNYLFNHISDIVAKYRLQGNWNNEAINLPSIPEEAVQEIKKLGITFTRQ